jgi:hypothetical protein
MALETLKLATRRGPVAMTAENANTTQKMSNLVIVSSTVEVAAAANDGSTYVLARIPSNARIHPLSTIYWDDLASSGTPTVDVGLRGAQITNDPNALADGLAVSTAAGSSRLVINIADIGKMAWELAGASSDPGGMLEVYASVVDAAANDGGTLSLCLVYSED